MSDGHPWVKLLASNMARLNELGGFEHLPELGTPVQMSVTNRAEELLELVLEPVGSDHWMKPGETFIVVSYGTWENHPFEVVYLPGSVQVWCTTSNGAVIDDQGNEIECGHQRPTSSSQISP